MKRRIALVADIALILLASVLALAVREDSTEWVAKLAVLLPYFGFTVLAAVVAISFAGLDRSIWRFSGMPDYIQIAGVALATVLMAVVLGFAMNRLEGVPRSLPFLQWLLILFVLVGARCFVRLQYLARVRGRAGRTVAPHAETGQKNVVLVGIGRLTDLYLETLLQSPAASVRAVGLLGRTDRHTGRMLHGVPILDTPDNVGRVLDELHNHGVDIDRIIVTQPFSELSDAARKALLMVEASTSIRLEFIGELLGIDGHSVAQTASGQSSVGASATEDGPIQLSLNQHTALLAENRAYWRVKRLIDFVGATLLLVVTLPVMILVAAVVAVELGAPILFWQMRPGRGGRKFKVFKFRTMASLRDLAGRPVHEDGRVSLAGQWLRRYRLDELPQLYNILIGQMSFIGPRPLLADDQPSAGFNPRLLVRPGLTGWAQVSGGRGISVDEKVNLDLWYVSNANLLLDLRIVWRTAVMLVVGERRDDVAIDLATRQVGKVWSGMGGSVIAES